MDNHDSIKDAARNELHKNMSFRKEKTVRIQNKRMKKPLSFAFYIVEGFSLVCLSSALEPLKIANLESSSKKYKWDLYSDKGKEISFGSGISVKTKALNQITEPPDYFLVCASLNYHRFESGLLGQWLQNMAQSKQTILGAMSTGTYLLAKYGVIKDYVVTIHWEAIPALKENFPSINVIHDIYIIDRDRVTCSGGLSAMDMVLEILQEYEKKELLEKIIHNSIRDRPRKGNQSQWKMLDAEVRNLSFDLYKATQFMRAGFHKNIKIEEIASASLVSVRQLERLFQKHLKTTPLKLLRKLRIDHAKYLLKHTRQPITDIALSSGFQSMSHFSTTFRADEGVSPSQFRKSYISQDMLRG